MLAVGAHCGWPLSSGTKEHSLYQATELLDSHPSIDLHCHPGLFPAHGTALYGGDEAVAQTVADMRAGNIWGGFFSLVADLALIELGPDGVTANRSFEPGEAWASYQQQMSALNELLGKLPAAAALGLDDMDMLHGQGTIAAFIACEGAHCLEGHPERVERIYVDGVRLLQLVHYAMDVMGDLQTHEAVYDGLSAVGREVVGEMDRLGMVIDVAHASFKTVTDITQVSDSPLVLSHSQLRHGDRQHPRLLEPEHAQAIAATGGVIGMWPSGFGNDSFDDFIDNTMRMIDLVGVDHVGLGTDMDGNYKPVFDSYRQLPHWAGGLLDKGLSGSEVGQVVGGNAIRVMKQVFQKGSGHV